jgi:hypothetical protein
MGRACSTHAGDYEIHTKFLLASLLGRDHSEDLGIDGSIMLKNAS